MLYNIVLKILPHKQVYTCIRFHFRSKRVDLAHICIIGTYLLLLETFKCLS